jgi:hypothetical protein
MMLSLMKQALVHGTQREGRDEMKVGRFLGSESKVIELLELQKPLRL